MQGLFGRLTAGALCVACLGAPLFAAPESAHRFQRARDDYARLDPAGQERWLADLFYKRSEPACRVCMDAEQRQRQTVRQRAVLARVHAGQRLTDGGLAKLLAEVDQQEQMAIENLAREFEFSTARTFHADRAQFEKWMATWHAVLDRWDRAGRPWDHQPVLIRWLQTAMTREQTISAQILKPAGETPAVAKTLPTKKLPSPASMEQRPAPRAVVHEMRPAPAIAKPRSGAIAIAKQSTPPSTLKKPLRETHPMSTTFKAVALWRPHSGADTIGRAAVRKVAMPSPRQQAARIVVPPVTIDIATKPRSSTSAKTASTAGPKVDLAELGARIAGYNLALTDLVSRLHDRQPWNAGQLDAAVDTLSDLAALREDLQLYWNLLPSDAHARLRPVQPLGPAIALVGAKTSAARVLLEQAASDDRAAGAPAERRRLDHVSRRLAELATARQ
jgi:hypothetical protein